MDNDVRATHLSCSRCPLWAAENRLQLMSKANALRRTEQRVSERVEWPAQLDKDECSEYTRLEKLKCWQRQEQGAGLAKRGVASSEIMISASHGKPDAWCIWVAEKWCEAVCTYLSVCQVVRLSHEESPVTRRWRGSDRNGEKLSWTSAGNDGMTISRLQLWVETSNWFQLISRQCRSREQAPGSMASHALVRERNHRGWERKEGKQWNKKENERSKREADQSVNRGRDQKNQNMAWNALIGCSNRKHAMTCQSQCKLLTAWQRSFTWTWFGSVWTSNHSGGLKGCLIPALIPGICKNYCGPAPLEEAFLLHEILRYLFRGRRHIDTQSNTRTRLHWLSGGAA